MARTNAYDGWRYAPLRAVVRVLAAIYLGRLFYDNSLHDLRQLTLPRVVVRTAAILLTLGFVYWNLAIVDPRIGAVLWTAVALLYGSILVLWRVVEAGVDYVDATDPLDRRQHAARNDVTSEVVESHAGRLEDRIE